MYRFYDFSFITMKSRVLIKWTCSLKDVWFVKITWACLLWILLWKEWYFIYEKSVNSMFEIKSVTKRLKFQCHFHKYQCIFLNIYTHFTNINVGTLLLPTELRLDFPIYISLAKSGDQFILMIWSYCSQRLIKI